MDNLKQVEYLKQIFLSEEGVNKYLLIRKVKFVQICRIFREHGIGHANLLQKIIAKDMEENMRNV